MSLTLEKLCEVLNQNFGEPFLEEGMVSADIWEDEETGEKSLAIQIGRRDVQIDSDGQVIGAGTML